jgi:sterol 3beta-glucosyltransferase
MSSLAYVTGPDQISTSGPGLDTRAELDEGGRIDLWMDLKHKLAKGAADLPEDYAVHIEEYAVDKNARDCPPLNIVIFLVGSRGESPTC